MEVKNVTYNKIAKTYPDSIFEPEVPSYKTEVIESSKSLYDKVLCDNASEKNFAQDLSRKDDQVKVFCKLPNDYYVLTPTGKYRPDWAIVYERKRSLET